MPNSSGSDFEIDRRPTFDGAKVLSPVRYSERWHYHWLVQLSLDTTIKEISELKPNSGWSTPIGSLSLTLAFTNGSREKALGARALCEVAAHAQSIGWTIYLREHVRRTVQSSNALAVWGYRDIRVGLATRLALLSTMERISGPLRFADLLGEVTVDPASLATVLGRLRCDGLIDFDLQRVLSLETKVRLVRDSSSERPEKARNEAESVDGKIVDRRHSEPPRVR